MASTVTELMRRRMMGASGGEPYLDGWTIGYRLNTLGEVESADNAISPYYEVNEGDELFYCNVGRNGNKGCGSYDASMNYSFIANGSQLLSGSNLVIPTGAVKVRVTMYLASIDDSYLYNETTQTYLFKGKNL